MAARRAVARRPARDRLRAPLVTGGVLAAGSALVVVADPSSPGGLVLCPLLATTGLACPLCGGLRTVHGLGTGDVAAAWFANPALTVLLPVAVLAWAAWTVRAALGRQAGSVPVWVVWSVVGLLTVFGVARNLPVLRPVLTGWLA